MAKITRWILALIVAGSIAGTAVAASDTASATLLGSGKTTNGDYFAAGGTVHVSGTVNGDAYVAGGSVNIDGIINGDLLVTGGTVTISGKVTGNVRATGGTINLTGEVDHNLSAAAGAITIDQKAILKGNLILAGGSIDIGASVPGNLNVAAGAVNLNSQIAGSVTAYVGQITLASGAAVSGTLYYTSNNVASIDSGAKVVGAITHKTFPAAVPTHKPFLLKIALSLGGLLASIIIGLVFLLLFPRFGAAAAKLAGKRPAPAIGLGVVTLIVGPFIGLALIITVVGLPLALIGLALYAVALVIGQVVLATWAGELMNVKFKLSFGLKTAYLAGALVVWILSQIPFIGPLLAFVGLMLGFGATLMQARDSRKSQTHKVVEA